MNKIAVIVLFVMLSGCFARQDALLPTATYDFAPIQTGKGHLPIVEIDLPSWLNTPAVQYRLRYRDPNQLHEYAYARWAGGQPAALLKQRLRVGLAGVVKDDCRLQLQLQEFSHVFAQPEQSSAELRGELRVLDSHRRVLASRQFAVSQASASADARGGVAAMAQAVDQLALEVATWMRADVAAKACRAA